MPLQQKVDPMKNPSVTLAAIEELLDDIFAIAEFGVDPAFSRFIPMVYDPIGFDWRGCFQAEFTERFNGVMIRGDSEVSKVWCIAFPREAVLEEIVNRAQPGDVILSHHPIDMECGDPRGRKGRGFIPVPTHLLR